MQLLLKEFLELEEQVGGRLGVFAQRIGGRCFIAHRSQERFLMCSVFKLPLVGHILSMVDSGRLQLNSIIPFRPDDLLEYAPITSKYLDSKTITVENLCVAALQYSDNTAANLLLGIQGGPSGLTSFVRTLGDYSTRFDRIEPFLNEPAENCDYDSSTPESMAAIVRKLLLESALCPASQELLKRWLIGNTTGSARLKAGVPSTWQVGDKTGTGANGTTNDLGVLYPPDSKPIVVAAFFTDSCGTRAECEATLAEVARIIVMRLAEAGEFGT